MMIFKFIHHDLKALAVVCAESATEAEALLRDHLHEQGLPNADWLAGATVIVRNPAVPGVVGCALV